MKGTRFWIWVTALAVVLTPGVAGAQTLGAAFTYQGQLKQAGQPVSGTADFEFTLWDTATGGNQVGPMVPVNNWTITNGLFTVVLNFGQDVFTGDARWLEIVVNGTSLTPRQKLTPAPYALALPGLWTQRNPVSPNLIGGWHQNTVADGVVGGTIGGGGRVDGANRVLGDFGTVAGGVNNQAGALEEARWGGHSTVGGGEGNTASGDWSTVSGGAYNTATDIWNTVGGGIHNTASGDRCATVGGGGTNTASGRTSTIGGGGFNTADGEWSTVAGGLTNSALGNESTVGGGENNQATGLHSTVGGGDTNEASGTTSTVAGGHANEASAADATVGGGDSNVASDFDTTIAGGDGNTASAQGATVGGGADNEASGFRSTVPGGSVNIAEGTYSFAAGRRSQALFNGMFVWADTSTDPFITGLDFPQPTEPNFTPGEDQFLARATGGVVFVTAINSTGESTAGVQVAAGGGSWSSLSDRNAKENFASVDIRDVLRRVCAMPITTWNYRSQSSTTRHIGPTAQDFHAAFEVGEDQRRITTIDADGVALAAIQGLHAVVQEKDSEILRLKERLSTLETLVSQLVANRRGGAE